MNVDTLLYVSIKWAQFALRFQVPSLAIFSNVRSKCSLQTVRPSVFKHNYLFQHKLFQFIAVRQSVPQTRNFLLFKRTTTTSCNCSLIPNVPTPNPSVIVTHIPRTGHAEVWLSRIMLQTFLADGIPVKQQRCSIPHIQNLVQMEHLTGSRVLQWRTNTSVEYSFSSSHDLSTGQGEEDSVQLLDNIQKGKFDWRRVSVTI